MEAIEQLGLGDYHTQPFHERWKWWFSPYINHFLQPDTIIPDLSNPQSWNRYSYVQNNSLKFTDPTGHRLYSGDTGCRDDIECNEFKKNEEIIQEKEHKKKCDHGDEDYCSTAVKHPGRVLGFVATSLISGAVAETFILGGGAAVVVDKAVTSAMTACLMNPACQQLLPKAYDPRVDAQTDKFHNFPRLLDPIIMKAADKTASGPYINYAIEGSVEVAGKVTTGVFEIGVKIVEWVPTIVHHFFNPG